MSSLSRSDTPLPRAFEYGVVASAALTFAASYGLNYGDDNASLGTMNGRHFEAAARTPE
jgi:hypothetical protein